MSCLRKGFKANNAREARRHPGVYMAASVICLGGSGASDRGDVTWGISRDDDANAV